MIEKLKAAIEDYIARASEAIQNGEVIVTAEFDESCGKTTYRIGFHRKDTNAPS